MRSQYGAVGGYGGYGYSTPSYGYPQTGMASYGSPYAAYQTYGGTPAYGDTLKMFWTYEEVQ